MHHITLTQKKDLHLVDVFFVNNIVKSLITFMTSQETFYLHTDTCVRENNGELEFQTPLIKLKFARQILFLNSKT